MWLALILWGVSSCICLLYRSIGIRLRKGPQATEIAAATEIQAIVHLPGCGGARARRGVLCYSMSLGGCARCPRMLGLTGMRADVKTESIQKEPRGLL